MIDTDSFVIEGKKNFIFRREPMYSRNSEWVVFDPNALEFYSLNTIAAEIFFVIYKELSEQEGYIFFHKKYDITFEEYKELKFELISNTPFFKYILVNDLINNIGLIL